jgi:hypothetical protein
MGPSILCAFLSSCSFKVYLAYVPGLCPIKEKIDGTGHGDPFEYPVCNKKTV